MIKIFGFIIGGVIAAIAAVNIVIKIYGVTDNIPTWVGIPIFLAAVAGGFIGVFISEKLY